ncbi:hypothetical protein Xph01_28190 [Micromonospora phaseoli]|nr:hypothetical protein Xph01_28190 [Micromonospora phaseoli]
MQAVAALVAGALAQWVPVATAMVIMAMLSLLVTAYLTPRLRRPIEMERTRVGV